MTWKYFTLDEFKCKCGCEQNHIDPVFVDELDKLRHVYGKPLIVTSGYRCPSHNAKVSRTGLTGPHTTGRAADVAVDRKNAFDLLKLAVYMEFFGIGVQQKGVRRFMHLDNLPNSAGQPRPTIWSY